MSLLSIVWAYLNPFGSPSIQGLIEDGTTQSGLLYCVYLPPGYDANNRYPVIYHLHGAGEFYGMMKREVLWTAQHAELNDFDVIIVAPSDPTKFSMWADGNQIHIASLFHNELIPKIESTYSVDENKCYLQGFSMGGFGAAFHAFTHPSKFKKVVLWDGAHHNWESLTSERAFIARDQFDNLKDNFMPWSPYTAIEKRAKEGTIKDTPVLMYSGNMEATDKYAKRLKECLDQNGADSQHIITELSHCLRFFLDAHATEAFDFFKK